jgi:predicted phage terminase large subunit-like protein
VTIDYDTIELKSKLLGSLLFFTQFFFKLRTGRDFIIPQPDGREAHVISICRELTSLFYGNTTKLKINIPPRYSKTELLIHFAAWSLAHYPDCNFIYTSYSHNLAAKQTSIIRDIISLPLYRKLFDIGISDITSAKDNFETTVGGSVYGVGAGGTITGRGAGIRGCDRFGGAFLMDDMHKPDEAQSDVMRDSVIDWYDNTAQSRMNNGDKTPQILIGQRVHEDDLPARMTEGKGWKPLIIPALDINKNALDPVMHDKQTLLRMQNDMPYVFASQYQQDPQPAGGGLFKQEWFYLTEEELDILASFITADTAETDKTYNDATVFSCWGLYKIKQGNIETDLYGLHWMDCVEIWVEPKDLLNEFMSFYSGCMRFHVKPKQAAIEKKSTGTTLVSVLKDIQGLQIIEINRSRNSGSKTDRFLEIQQFVASKRISLPRLGKHTNMCIEHCKKITANNTHARDDIADTLADAVKIALIDQTIIYRNVKSTNNEATAIVKAMANDFNKLQRLRSTRQW